MTLKKGLLFGITLLIVLGVFLVRSGSNYPRCANSLSCEQSDYALRVDNETRGIFMGKAVVPPKIDLDDVGVLGEATASGKKKIFIDLETQSLTAFEEDEVFMQALVSTGKWGRTPTGEFRVWSKFKATRMSGGQGNDYYDLPNVPFTMFFSGPKVAASRGFAVHGAYWHNNFGHPMSHGCVNMRIVDAEKLFYWADKNTLITIYGKAPL